MNIRILDCDKISYNPEMKKCPICGSEDTYEIIVKDDKIIFLFYRRFVKGKEVFLCKKHFKISRFFDDLIYKIIFILSKFI